ncbi:hypothetical protein [Frankia sp. CiP3]|uniref:hypothetical protein n=1 Tax=Frankia sp. CiP3 TaxID=2880971 RepID=UPI001EF628D1|nr:hypothetical protein [Frankia sp. CiP3]
MTPHTTTALATAGALLLAGLLTGCNPDQSGRDPQTVATTPAPQPAQIAELRSRLQALPSVTIADVSYVPGVKALVDGVWKIRLTATGLDKPALIQLADLTYRTIWQDTAVPYADPELVVTNGSGTGVGYRDLGLDVPPVYTDLRTRYGPRPTS